MILSQFDSGKPSFGKEKFTDPVFKKYADRGLHHTKFR